MKTILILIIAVLAFAKSSYSQDIITLNSGEKLRVKVIQVCKKSVKYAKLDDMNGSTYDIDVSKILFIIFEKNNRKYIGAANFYNGNSSKDIVESSTQRPKY